MPSLPHLLKMALLAAAYFGAAKLALLVAIPPGYATAVWPPSGIALAALVLYGNRAWPGVWLGAALTNLTVNFSPLAAVLIASGNTLEALAGAWLVGRNIGKLRHFERSEDVMQFVAIAALAATVAATAASVPLYILHALPARDLEWNWWTWWQGDAMGMVIVAPLALSWTARAPEPWPAARIAELAALAALWLAASLVIFGDAAGPVLGPVSPATTFAILPFVIWAGLRFRLREITTLNAAVCAIAVGFTLKGHGPFAQATINTSLLLLLAFICTVVTTGMALNASVEERGRAIATLERVLRDLREQALRDPLTDLYNRRFLEDYLARELIRAARDKLPLAIVMLDLDHFKRVNDTYGHAMGDAVLSKVAALLRRQVRGSDIACRWGGEEFVVVLPGAGVEIARQRSEALCEAVRQESWDLYGVTASLGVAVCPDHARDAAELLRAADAALYESKGRGRNRVTLYASPESGGLLTRSGRWLFGGRSARR